MYGAVYLTCYAQIINDFPKPPPPPSDPLSSSSNANTPARQQNIISSQESTTADKENAPPTTPPRPPVPAFTSTPSQSSDSFPSEMINFYSSVRQTLSKNFSKNPPHTIQRLAELILEPKQRYRFLPAYLRALDRVVSVSSPTTIFPLPQAMLPNAGLLNGTAASPPSALGSDESLGGALLTPIPWLQNRNNQSELISESTEMVDGPNGAGRIETVSVNTLASNPPAPVPPPQPQIQSSHPDGESLPSTGPVTQGEILRQEQEAGVVLSNPHAIQPNRTIGEIEGAGIVIETVEGEEEVPHARGPEIIGLEDTGPQKSGGGLDIEGAVGRPSIERSSKSPGPVAEDAKEDGKDEEMKDGETEAEGEAKKDDKDEEMKTDE